MSDNLANPAARASRPKPIALLSLAVGLTCLIAAVRSTAQVLEVQDDGTVVTYDGPTQVLSADSRPVALRATWPRRGGGARSASRNAIQVIRYDGFMPPPAAGPGAVALAKNGARRAFGARAAPPTAIVAQALRLAAARHQVSERLVEAVAWQESGFNPQAVSPKGARGMMQLMPQTARLLGVNADDEAGNIDGGADYLSRMMRRFGGDTTKALAAYNAGPEAVERYGGVPPYAETIAYVGSVLSHLNRVGDIPSIVTVPQPAPGPGF